MASNRDDFQAIRTRFAALWPSSVTVVKANGPNKAKPSDAVWARLTIQPGFSDRPSIGLNKRYVQYGRIYLQIFTPAQDGENQAWDLAETFTTMFRDWTSPDGRIRCDQPEFSVSTEEQEYYAIRCSIPYHADH